MINNNLIFKIYFIIFFKIWTFKGQKGPFKKPVGIGEIGALSITEFKQTRALVGEIGKTIRKDRSPMFSERQRSLGFGEIGVPFKIVSSYFCGFDTCIFLPTYAYLVVFFS